jgi:DtxR family transcriptional regulator, Mn-dependent transcriptional regulator
MYLPRMSDTVDDYLKAIYLLGRDGEAVSTSSIARKLSLSEASVTGMIRKLAARKLLRHTPYRGVRLTLSGEALALRLIRKHRLWELFLVQHLKFGWEEVHDHAERLEHATDDELERRLFEMLGRPDRDPHGDPIPGDDGKEKETARRTLATMKEGERGEILRCLDQDAGLLDHLRRMGLRPGRKFRISGREPYGGPISLVLGNKTVRIGPAVAGALVVRGPRSAGS